MNPVWEQVASRLFRRTNCLRILKGGMSTMPSLKCAAVLAIMALVSHNSVFSPAFAKRVTVLRNLVGIVNLSLYCENTYGGKALNVDNTPEGWRCRPGGQPILSRSITAACRQQFDNNALVAAVRKDVTWACYLPR